jgi:hypothetical protein
VVLSSVPDLILGLGLFRDRAPAASRLARDYHAVAIEGFVGPDPHPRRGGAYCAAGLPDLLPVATDGYFGALTGE